MSQTMLKYENAAKQQGFSLALGLDEAGRGPLAGPVVASAVALNDYEFRNKVCDSKKLSASQREKAYHEIIDNAYVGVGIIDEAVIDSVNILEATYLAMSRAVKYLVEKLPEDKRENICLLVDGNRFKTDLPYSFQTIVKGDNLSMSIACASIIAKVTRDRILIEYDKIFPEYGFKKHKGYPTVQHKEAIKKHGLSIIHRKTFKSF